jgi:DNA repair protein RecN (Recombination protein N)
LGRMLAELRVSNLGLLKEALVEFGPGLNVLTGESGAGKTLCVEAIGLLSGSRARREAVGPFGDKAVVEGRLLVPDKLLAVMLRGMATGSTGGLGDGDRVSHPFSAAGDSDTSASAAMPEWALSVSPDEGGGASEIVVRRIVDSAGRSRQYINGSLVTLGELQSLIGPLVAVYGQFSAASLLNSKVQAETLDAFGGDELDRAKRRYIGLYREMKRLEKALKSFDSPQEIRREIDFLKFQIAEIEAARPRPQEREELEAELERLEKAVELKQGLGTLALSLDRLADELFAQVRISAAFGRSDASSDGAGENPGARKDPVTDLLDRVERVCIEARELQSEARELADSLEEDPRRLAEVRQRLDVLASLERKYGPTLAGVLDYLEAAKGRLAELECSETAAGTTLERLDRIRKEIEAAADELNRVRAEAAADLSRKTKQLLRRLGMKSAQFEIIVRRRQPKEPAEGETFEKESPSRSQAAFGPDGADDVTFVFSPLREVDAKPIEKVASGGELARTMLALEVAVGDAGGALTLVFDEVDQGVGGRAATTVGELLASLAKTRQVLCVTHLAQVASFADTHFVVERENQSTKVFEISGKDRVREISRMLGSDPSSAAAARHASEIIERARELKAS